MLTHIRYILLTALRDSLFIGLLLGVLIATALSATLGSTASVEKAAMTAAFSSSSARIILILGLIVFVCFHVRQAFDQKEIDVLLSRPLSRFHIILAYWLGFSVVAFLLVLPIAAIISCLPAFNIEGFYYWSASLLLESWIAVAIALFASFTLRSGVSSVLASLGFYALARMMGFFVATSDSGMMFRELWLNSLLEYTIKAVAMITPRLDLFTQSEWLVYGLVRPEDTTLALVQAAIIIPLLIVATTVDFMRKQF